jgi:hypothetical protein
VLLASPLLFCKDKEAFIQAAGHKEFLDIAFFANLAEFGGDNYSPFIINCMFVFSVKHFTPPLSTTLYHEVYIIAHGLSRVKISFFIEIQQVVENNWKIIKIWSILKKKNLKIFPLFKIISLDQVKLRSF